MVDFEVGDFVWAILTKDRFPIGECNKLATRKIGPLEILDKINSNAYGLKLPNHIPTSMSSTLFHTEVTTLKMILLICGWILSNLGRMMHHV